MELLHKTTLLRAGDNINKIYRAKNEISNSNFYRVRETARIYPTRKTKANNTMKCLANLLAPKMVTEDKYESR